MRNDRRSTFTEFRPMSPRQLPAGHCCRIAVEVRDATEKIEGAMPETASESDGGKIGYGIYAAPASIMIVIIIQ
jgi:hypothetical protein